LVADRQATITINVPGGLAADPVYIVVSLTPEGKDWNARLAEDRTYLVTIGGGARRALRAV
jgi:hypothetical protein